MHKILQSIFFTTHSGNFEDDLNRIPWVESDELLENCFCQWYTNNAIVTFPSKSINVAVIYSVLLTDAFGGNVYDYLSDPNLMYGLDKYFKPYPEYKLEYDAMLALITVDAIMKNQTPSVKATVNYFNQEFMIGSPEYSALFG